MFRKHPVRCCAAGIALAVLGGLVPDWPGGLAMVIGGALSVLGVAHLDDGASGGPPRPSA